MTGFMPVTKDWSFSYHADLDLLGSMVFRPWFVPEPQEFKIGKINFTYEMVKRDNFKFPTFETLAKIVDFDGAKLVAAFQAAPSWLRVTMGKTIRRIQNVELELFADNCYFKPKFFDPGILNPELKKNFTLISPDLKSERALKRVVDATEFKAKKRIYKSIISRLEDFDVFLMIKELLHNSLFTGFNEKNRNILSFRYRGTQYQVFNGTSHGSVKSFLKKLIHRRSSISFSDLKGI